MRGKETEQKIAENALAKTKYPSLLAPVSNRLYAAHPGAQKQGL